MSLARSTAVFRMMSGWRRALCSAAALAAAWAGAAEGPPAKESQVKAAFLYNFTKFVEWPPERLGAPEGPFVIGLFARDELRADLEQAVRGRRVNGRPIELKLLRAPGDVAGVHLLFVGRAAEGELRDSWRAPGVLAVGESEAFLERGGTIAFVAVGENLRFAINMEAATRAGLKVSAQLQKLAVSIRKTP